MKRSAKKPDDPLARLTAGVSPVLRKAGLISVIAHLLWIVQAAAVATIIDNLVGEHSDSVVPWVAAAVFAFTGLCRSLLEQHSARLCFRAADDVIAESRQTLLRREALRSPMDPGRPSSAAIASLVAEKIAILQPFLMRYTTARARVMVVPLAILLVSLPFSWVVSIILLVVGPLIPVFMALIGMAARDASEKHLQQLGTLNASLLERLNALMDIRILDASQHTLDGFSESASLLHRRTMAVLRIAFLSSTVLELFAAIGVAMVALYTGFVLLGEISFGYWGDRLSIGEGIFLLMLAPEFFQPLRDLATAWHDRASAQAVANELHELSQQEALQILGTGGAATATASLGTEEAALLHSSDLSWKTSAGQTLIFPDLTAFPGQSIALCGASGSGKSTLLALLAGLLKPQSGSVELAGQTLDTENADHWRSQIAWMSQSPWFINGSLRDNLALTGNAIDDPDSVNRALTLASVRPLLDALPDGLDTLLGESGSGVSGGEARRLTLARLALTNRPVILADEPTSDLDAATAEAVTEGLLSLAARGATLILATHDPQLMSRVDRCIQIGDQP